MIKFDKLSESDIKSARDLLEMGFLQGSCYVLAIAMHQATGYRLVGLMDGEEIHHAGVRDPEGRFFDARGFVEEDRIRELFMHAGPLPERNIEVGNLAAHPRVNAHTVERAAALAQVAYPELPWKEGTQKARIESFMTELEALCRRYNIWIRETGPTSLPIVYPVEEGDGFEKGFGLMSEMTGSGYFVRRLVD